jgi:predicted nucleotidyltransferase
MDLSDPTRAVTSSLDGTVLAVLAPAGSPLTIGQIAERAARGSEIGIRRCVDRLVEQGIVRATVMGRNRVHELNHDHVAAGVALILAELRPELWKRFREHLKKWKVRPVHAVVFGSAARGDGGVDSDIDLLLVHPPFPGEKPTRRLDATTVKRLGEAAASFARAPSEMDALAKWEEQVAGLREKVFAWTGNHLQIVDLSYYDWQRPPSSFEPLLASVRAEGIEVHRAMLTTKVARG